MRNHGLISLSLLGLLACSGNKMQTTDGGDGSGQGGSDGGQAGRGGRGGGGGGQAGSTAGAAGSAAGAGATGGAGGAAAGGTTGAGGRGGASGGTSGTGGTTGAGGTGGTTGAGGTGGTTGAGGTGGTTGAGGSGGSAGTAGTGGSGAASGTGGTTGAGGTGGSGGVTGTGGGGAPGLRLLAGGLGGPGNVDGIGAAARLSGTAGIASDGADNLYLVGNDIRKVALATGAVTTVGTSAPIGASGAVVDGAGNLFVSDRSNYTVSKVVIATGAVTRIAGTPGSSGSDDGTGANASFIGPSGIAADGAGNLYVADSVSGDFWNRTLVRKVVISTGAVTTVADIPGSYFTSLGRIAIDGAGNLYVAYDSAVLKVAPTTGAVTTLAGVKGQPGDVDGTGASARFSLLSNIMSDGAGNLYVTSAGAATIRKIVIATGAVTTLADATGAALTFNEPRGIAGSGSGDLYVSDDATLRKVVIATGAVTLVAGAASQPGSADATGAGARFNRPYAVASDGAGNLYVADSNNSTIRKVVVATGAVTTLAGAAGQYGNVDGTGASARFYRPSGIASDGAGNIYVVDGIIRKIVVATGEVTTLTTGPGRDANQPGPTGIASDGAGNLYFDEAGTTIWKVAIASAALTKIAGTAGQYGSLDEIGAAASFNGPTAIAADGVGNLYVTDAGNATIRKIVLATKAVTTLAGLAGAYGTADGIGAAARFNYPISITSDGAGHLYVAETNVIRKIVIATATVSTIIGAPNRLGVSLGALPASLRSPQGVVVLPTGELAIADWFENAILIGRL